MSRPTIVDVGRFVRVYLSMGRKVWRPPTHKQVAKRLGVSPRTVMRYIREYESGRRQGAQ